MRPGLYYHPEHEVLVQLDKKGFAWVEMTYTYLDGKSSTAGCYIASFFHSYSKEFEFIGVV